MSETQWKSNTTFLLAMIGAAVGLGNIWRFPYVFFNNGLGSFLIPYLIAILLLGLPAVLLEYAIGVKFKTSILTIYTKVNKKYQIIGWAIVFISFLLATYETGIMSWDLNYLILSFTKSWGANPDFFFNHVLLQTNTSLSGLFNIVPWLLIAIACIWIFLWYISHKDLNKGIGLFTTIFVPILFILCIGIAIYNMTLPGAYIGYMQFFNPNWSLLLSYNIWVAAFGQILFTLSLGGGAIIAYSSHLPDGTNLTKNAITVIFSNCAFELINAVGIFSLLGYLSYSTGFAFNEIITEGSGLAFVAFPQTFNLLGSIGFILGPLFFFSIMIAGLTTAVSDLEPIFETVSDQFNFSRKKSVTIICIIGFIISILYATQMSDLMIKLIDGAISNFALLFIIILECVIFGYIYNIDNLIEVLNQKTLIKVRVWWKYIIKYILPIFLTILWILGIIELLRSINLFSAIVYIIILSSILIIPFILSHYSKNNNSST